MSQASGKRAAPNYLGGYPAHLRERIEQMIEAQQLAGWLLQKYPAPHRVRSDRALYDYVCEVKNSAFRHAGQLRRVAFDRRLHLTHQALGLHSSRSHAHGSKLRKVRDIHISTLFMDAPLEFLRMIVVHELAHMKEPEHDKAFYQLCCNMEPDYHQLEFELRAYLTYLDRGGEPLWSSDIPDQERG